MDARAGRTDGLQGPDKTDGRTDGAGRTNGQGGPDGPASGEGGNKPPSPAPPLHTHLGTERKNILFVFPNPKCPAPASRYFESAGRNLPVALSVARSVRSEALYEE